jgi:putative ABC transport system permease protein
MVFSPGLLEQAPQTHIATVKADPAAEDGLEIAVTDAFPNVSAIRVKEAVEAFGGIIGQVAVAVRSTASVALLAGVLVLAGAIAAGQQRRIYDAVVLKVLGATRRMTGLGYLFEFGLLGLATALLSLLFGTLAAWLVLTRVMELPFGFLPWTALATVLAAVATTALFGFAGTWRALSQKAAPLLRNE